MMFRHWRHGGLAVRDEKPGKQAIFKQAIVCEEFFKPMRLAEPARGDARLFHHHRITKEAVNFNMIP